MENSMDETERAKMNPTNTFMKACPNFTKKFNKPERYKLRPLEESHERPFVPYHMCDLEKFTLAMCGRNMAKKHARRACSEEMHDLKECMTARVQDRSRVRLLKASEQVGDKIPRKSSMFWQY